MLTLIVETSGNRQTLTFPRQTVTIGRAEDNDLRISSRFVSQQHCRIESDDGVIYRLVDLDSQNGTRLNGKAVSDEPLRPGDGVQIGPILIWFQSAPVEHTASWDRGAEEFTDPNDEEVRVVARVGSGTASKLAETLRDLMIEFRKNYGDDRGITEFEKSVMHVSGEVFPRTAFQEQADLSKLLRVGHAMTTATNPQTVLALIMDAAIEITDSERGFLVLREEEGSWKVKIARNFDQEAVRGAEGKISRSISQQVARTGRPLVSVNAQQDRRFENINSVSELRLRSVMCVPLTLRDSVIGTLYLDNRFREGIYQDSSLGLMENFADHAAIAIENARLLQSNLEQEAALAQRTQEIEELAQVLDSRLKDAAEVNAASPKALSREGLKHDYSMIIGESPVMIEMFRLIDRVASSDIPVLITGESGTGKELVAQAIHQNSLRCNGQLIKENCAAIPTSLMESEFFGYQKGAFTGANADRKGLFQQAHEGTIFLDEIGEMSTDMQSKMLRVLQNGEIRPVGSRQVAHVDVRLLTATNRNLRKMVDEGAFREDLFYRLNVICIEVPPLRERLEDVPLLVQHFLSIAAKESKAKPKSIDPLAMRYILTYHWPGNVRELQNEIYRAVALSGGVVTVDDLSKEITQGRQVSTQSPDGATGLKELVKLATHQKEREIILRTLEECDWQKSGAARKLQVSRPTLDQKIKAHGLGVFITRGRQKS